MCVYNFDVLVIGTGVAGLSAAAKLAEQNLNVGIITRERDPNETNTRYAQGGIIFSDHAYGTNEKMTEDIQNASSNTSLEWAIKHFSDRSGEIVRELLIDKAGTGFERKVDGDLAFTKEASHSCHRILFKGDYTGKEIQISLLNYLKDEKRFPNVKILTAHTAVDLLTAIHHGTSLMQKYEKKRILGAYVFDQDKGIVHKVMAGVTLLATGGIGSLYLHHSNSEGARGDGHAMAKRAGATLVNMEFIQFHPTTFFDASGHRRFLVSEAVRGEGGILYNSEGEAFMERYHPDRELAPRDVVSRSIDEEMIRTNHECVYLDISHKPAEWIKERFPTIYEHCLKKKVDMTKEPIPVVPAAHYTCGGVLTNVHGETDMAGLYAAGEVACTGLHGANRLASTSLAEGLTWGYSAAEHISENLKDFPIYDGDMIQDWYSGTEEADPALIHQDWLTLKQTMWNYVGLTRTSNRLKRAYAMFRELFVEVKKFYKHAEMSDELIGLQNAVEVAYLVLGASQRNRKSVGCFFRK